MAYLDQYSVHYLELETDKTDSGVDPSNWSGSATFSGQWLTKGKISATIEYGMKDFTIDFWMRKVGVPTTEDIFLSLGDSFITMSISTSGNSVLRYGSEVGEASSHIENQDYHIAIIYVHSSMRAYLYINGQYKSSHMLSLSRHPNTCTFGSSISNIIYVRHFHFSDGIARWSENFTPPTYWEIPEKTPTIYYNTYDGNTLKISTQISADGPSVPVYFNNKIYYVPIVTVNDNPSKIRIRYNKQNLYLQAMKTYQELLATPKLSFTSKEYTGSNITPPTYTTYDVPEVEISGTGLTAKKNVGTYKISYTITNTKKYGWAGTDNATYNATWQITKQGVAVPSLTTQFTYNKGVSQGPTVSSSLYSLTNNSQINVGDYTATLSLANTSLYQWKDTKDSNPRNISFTINKKPYSGTAELTVKLTDYNTKRKAFIGTFAVYNPTTKTTSSADLTGSTADSKPFNGSSNDIILSCGGELSTSIITLDPAKSTNTQVVQPKFTHAGTYKIAISLMDKDNTTATITNENQTITGTGGIISIIKTVTIQPLRILTSLKSSELTWEYAYDGANHAPTLKSGSFFAKVMDISSTARSAAGESTFTLTIKSTYAGDIIWVDSSTKADISSASRTFTWKINKKQLTVPKQVGECAYTSNQCTPTWNSDFNSTYMEVISYTASGESSTRKNPGTYHATIGIKSSMKSNVEWSDGTTDNKTVEWKIAGKAIDPPEFEYELYIKNYNTPTQNLYDAAKLKNMNGITITDKKYTANKNNLTYTVQLTDPSSTWSDGYSDTSRTVSVTVQYFTVNTIRRTLFYIESIEESESAFPTRASGKADPLIARIRSGPRDTESYSIDSKFNYLRITYSIRLGDNNITESLKSLGNKLGWSVTHQKLYNDSPITDDMTISSIERFDDYCKFQITVSLTPPDIDVTPITKYVIDMAMPTVAVGTTLFLGNSQTLTLIPSYRQEIIGRAWIKKDTSSGWGNNTYTTLEYQGPYQVYGSGHTVSAQRFIFDLRNQYKKLTTTHRISFCFNCTAKEGYTDAYIEYLQSKNAQCSLSKNMDDYLHSSIRNKITSASVSTEITKSGTTTTAWTYVDITTQNNMANTTAGTSTPFHTFRGTLKNFYRPEMSHTLKLDFIYGDVPNFKTEENYDPHFYNPELYEILGNFSRGGSDASDSSAPHFFLAAHWAKNSYLDYVRGADTRNWYEKSSYCKTILYGSSTTQRIASNLRLYFQYVNSSGKTVAFTPVSPVSEGTDFPDGTSYTQQDSCLINASSKWKLYYSDGKKYTYDQYYNKKLIYNYGQSPEGWVINEEWDNWGYTDFIMARWLRTEPSEDVSSYNNKTILEQYGAEMTFDICWKGEIMNNKKITTYLESYSNLSNKSLAPEKARSWVAFEIKHV